MQHFYFAFNAKQQKALALQSAMLALRAEFPHPYFWAPFVLVGKVFA